MESPEEKMIDFYILKKRPEEALFKVIKISFFARTCNE
jgi:hypothetical protein